MGQAGGTACGHTHQCRFLHGELRRLQDHTTLAAPNRTFPPVNRGPGSVSRAYHQTAVGRRPTCREPRLAPRPVQMPLPYPATTMRPGYHSPWRAGRVEGRPSRAAGLPIRSHQRPSALTRRIDGAGQGASPSSRSPDTQTRKRLWLSNTNPGWHSAVTRRSRARPGKSGPRRTWIVTPPPSVAAPDLLGASPPPPPASHLRLPVIQIHRHHGSGKLLGWSRGSVRLQCVPFLTP